MANHVPAFIQRLFTLRFLRFVFIGGLSSCIYAVVVWTLLYQNLMPTFAASVVGYCVAIPFNFIGQKRFTFRSTAKSMREILTFIAVQVFNIILSGAIMLVVVDYLGWPSVIGIVCVIAAIPVSTYLLLRGFVFISAEAR